MESTITVYGADWCPDCRRAKSFLKENHIEFNYIDIDVDNAHVKTVEAINNGKRIIPTITILGQTYTNPTYSTLSNVLGINSFGKIVFYGAEWCPDCKRAKAFLEQSSVNYQFISIDKHEWAAEKVEKINKGKRIIPTLIINDVPYTNPDNKTLTEVLSLDLAHTDQVFDCIVIGAGASGLTAALYLQREKFSTLILEKKNIGGNTFITKKIENYPGFKTISGPELMETMAEQAREVGTEIKEGYEVNSIKKEGLTFKLETDLGTFRSKTIVAAVGSTYRRLKIPGETQLIGSGVHFCATCDGPFYKNKTVIVIGGGNSAVEEGIYLSEICKHVHIVSKTDRFTATSTYLEKLQERPNITSHMSKTCLEFLSGSSEEFAGLKIKDNANDQEETIQADGVFIFIGLIPNTTFLKDIIQLDDKGFILTDCGTVETSISGFFAAGDARKGAIAQVAAATGEGVIASFGVKEYLRSTS